MLTESQEFVTTLVGWINTFLTDRANKGDDEGETLQHMSHVLRTMMEMLHAARAPGRGPYPPGKKGARIFWGTLQAVTVMRKLREANLSAHPALSHILNLHLQDNSVTKSEMAGMEKRLKAILDEVKILKSATDRGVRAATAAKKKAKAAWGGGIGPYLKEGGGDSLNGLASAQVELSIDPLGDLLTFGILGENPDQRWWQLFTKRLGSVEWTSGDVQQTPSDREAELSTLGSLKPVDVVLMETGRLRRNSVVWAMERTKIVISFEGWREPPPPEGMAHVPEEVEARSTWGSDGRRVLRQHCL
jgi:hypothetical protein